ncbi:MAG TPA: Gfo/Idh/MocA family oxidoreductase [Chthoniobacterales bacterium]
MSRGVRIGIVGVGSIGKNHARICAGLPNALFTAVLDADPNAAETIGRTYGVPVAATLEGFSEQVDAATIAAPTPFHFELAHFLLSRGKHVLVEKPITEKPDEAKALVDLARERRLVLQVGHVERFNPVLGALEAHLTRPRFIEAHRLSPYPFRSVEIGVVLDLMIHDLEVVLHLVRSPVETVDAVGVPVLSRGEDIANARLRFRNGAVANITASRISPEKMRKIRVFQENAYLSLDYQNQTGEIYRLLDGRIVRENVEIEKDEPLKLELQSFVDCCRRGGEPVVSGPQAAAALELAIDITERIRRSKTEFERP